MKSFREFITEIEDPNFRMPNEMIKKNMEILNKHQRLSLRKHFGGRNITHLRVKPMGGVHHEVVVHFDNVVQHQFLIGNRGGITKSGVSINSLRTGKN